MRRRPGFTLVEVMIALTIMGIVTGAVYQVLVTNQRVSLAQAEQVSLQGNVRTGSLVVPNELRELNTWLGGAADRNDIIPPLDDDAITYRAMRGLGFVCQAPGGATKLRVAASSWAGLRPPDPARDDLYLFVDGIENDDADDSWLQVDVTGAAAVNNTCGGAPGYELDAAAFPDVPVNTPVRLYEVMELKLHPQDGQLWLGARSVSAGGAMQPVLGPLTANGFALEYLDSNGNPTVNERAVKSVRLTVRGLTEEAVRIGGSGSGAMGHPEEALVTQVLLRNSIRP
jgi:prepilin-type N-terminal cleavage/methylation domain-containing protein